MQFVPLAVLILALGVVAIAGGISGVRGERWWLLVVGVATSVFRFLSLGLPALIFAVIAEKEFSRPLR